ncbi:restriction endonuclease subunit S [Stenotrophomonas maltophilia]|uniref:restriction endonuclease subunit S n=1 Tax=Stenotrophomonas maltophilia TaxID=40324 RepID=UPI002096998F|nr:restriction endonuclease subunit S [Stenotrophomonas maltophilia]MCO7398464.1 restriction endonuclease subunit S [Stenotrophomonas maltophilia]MCO7410950.1 restriction endonuclease subunit S [Stenotrophomonas maltophilia]
MSLLDLANQDGRAWARIGDSYGVTKKPRELDVRSHAAIPFIPMESVPQGGAYEPGFTLKSPDALTSGTYFELGDVLVSKITPSFENGKQALVQSLPLPFGYATTEVIPLHPLDSSKHDPRLLFFYLLHPDVRHFVAERMEGSTGRRRVPEGVLLDLPMPDIAPQEQTHAADALELIQTAMAVEDKAAQNAQELKRAAMARLFTRGLRGEAPKETEIGLVPERWGVERLDSIAQVVSTRMAYSELEAAEATQENSVRVIGIKVSDMNREGNETVLAWAALEKTLDAKLAEYRCAPTGTIVFPKRGAAIATNKKRLTTTWSVFDPNVIGVVPGASINPGFLFHWFQSFDLKTITEPGPTPQLNKKHLDPLLIPVPADTDEQREIVAILDALDRKIALHHKKRAVLEELFQSLLHKLMIGEICVADLDLSTLPVAPAQTLEATA